MNLYKLKEFIKQNGGTVTVALLQQAFSLDYPEARRLIGVLEKNGYIAFSGGIEYVYAEKEYKRDDDVDDADDEEEEDCLRHSDEDESFDGKVSEADKSGESEDNGGEQTDDGEDNDESTKKLHTSFSEFLKRYRRQAAEMESKKSETGPRIGENKVTPPFRGENYHRIFITRQGDRNYTGVPEQNYYLNSFHNAFTFDRAGDDLYEIHLTGCELYKGFVDCPVFVDFNGGAPVLTDNAGVVKLLVDKIGYEAAETKLNDFFEEENDFDFLSYKILLQTDAKTAMLDYIKFCCLIYKLVCE